MSQNLSSAAAMIGALKVKAVKQTCVIVAFAWNNNFFLILDMSIQNRVCFITMSFQCIMIWEINAK